MDRREREEAPYDLEALKADIKKNGLLTPIKVSSDHRILDGWHRFQACKQLGIDLKYEVVSESTGWPLDPVIHTIRGDKLKGIGAV
jgi:ParB-like chromosome segregation protein Spo0J